MNILMTAEQLARHIDNGDGPKVARIINSTPRVSLMTAAYADNVRNAINPS